MTRTCVDLSIVPREKHYLFHARSLLASHFCYILYIVSATATANHRHLRRLILKMMMERRVQRRWRKLVAFLSYGSGGECARFSDLSFFALLCQPNNNMRVTKVDVIAAALLVGGIGALTVSVLLCLQLALAPSFSPFVLPLWPYPVLPLAATCGIFLGLWMLAMALGIFVRVRRRRAPYQNL